MSNQLRCCRMRSSFCLGLAFRGRSILRMPNGEDIVSSPISSTLICGERDAVLVDPPLTNGQIAQSRRVWLARATARVCVHHPRHPDHWFGTASLLERFGDADSVVYATEGTIRQMRVQLEVRRRGSLGSFPDVPGNTRFWPSPFPPTVFGWMARFCAPSRPATPTRTTPTHYMCLDRPRRRRRCRVQRRASDDARRRRRRPSSVARRNRSDRRAQPAAMWSPATRTKTCPTTRKILDETRQYLRDTIRLLADKPTALEFFDEMMKLHGDRSTCPLWYSGLGLLALRTRRSGALACAPCGRLPTRHLPR